MSSTSTSTTTQTRTQTAVFLTDVVMGTIADILADLRIDVTALYRDWKQDEAAIAAWIGLSAIVVLTFVPPEQIDGNACCPAWRFLARLVCSHTNHWNGVCGNCQ